MNPVFEKHFEECARLIGSLGEGELFKAMDGMLKEIIDALKNGKKILIGGNGGSAAQAQHFATELVVRYKVNRRGLAAIALNADTSLLTAAGNDLGFEQIFSRQIEALANSGDVFLGISTSGKSPNILEGFKKAQSMGLKTIGLFGERSPQDVSVDLSLNVPSCDTALIQEMHLVIVHALCEGIEAAFL